MEKPIEEKYERAGKISVELVEYGKGLIKRGERILDICNKIEQRIFETGAKPAFPVQISINNTAAHYCPDDEDNTILTEELVSLDIGIHIDGCIADTAITLDLSQKYSDLIKASNTALDNAIKIITPGITLGEIGKTIEESINSFGFKPVKNLSGHGLGLYNVHTSPTIPNFNTQDKTKLKDGMVIAIEPFATNGIGLIHEKGYSTLFSMNKPAFMRTDFIRDIIKHIETYNGLPFTTRWLTRAFTKQQVSYTLNKLQKDGIITSYPPLVEVSNGFVSQSEHTVIIGEKSKIITKP